MSRVRRQDPIKCCYLGSYWFSCFSQPSVQSNIRGSQTSYSDICLCVSRLCSRQSWFCRDAFQDGIRRTELQASPLRLRLQLPFDNVPAHHPHTGTKGGLGTLVPSMHQTRSAEKDSRVQD